jgi:hypothetical protein
MPASSGCRPRQSHASSVRPRRCESAFSLVDLLENGEYVARQHFYDKPDRTEDILGVWASAASTMRAYFGRAAAPTGPTLGCRRRCARPALTSLLCRRSRRGRQSISYAPMARPSGARDPAGSAPPVVQAGRRKTELVGGGGALVRQQSECSGRRGGGLMRQFLWRGHDKQQHRTGRSRDGDVP